MSTPGGGPELRIGDAEREAAVSALGDHYAAGRLSKEEYDERAARVYEARTRSALWPLFADLPRPESASSSERPTASPAGERQRGGHPGWRLGAALVPMLVVFFVVSVLVGHPVFLLIVLGLLLWKATRFWRHGPGPRHHHHGHQRGWR